MPALPRHRIAILGALVLAVAALAATACGGGEAGPDAADNPGGGAVILNLTAGDYYFRPTQFTVKAGQRVTINVTNEGQAVHMVRVAGDDRRYDTDDDAVAEPYTIYAGRTGVVSWTAPDQPGTYAFRCDFHPQQTGIITVE